MKRGKGFTLIELLVVIAIIAILAAILFPVFVKAQQASKRAACIGNLKQVTSGLMLYAENYSGNYPTWKPGTTTSFWPYGDWDPRDKQTWKSGIQWGLRAAQKYVRNRSMFFCPSGMIKEKDVLLKDGSIAYAGYSYWGNYITPELNDRMVAVNVGRYPRSLLVSDIIVTINGKPAMANNHQPNGSPEGGNIAYNDGHVQWKWFQKMSKLFSRTPDAGVNNYEFYY